MKLSGKALAVFIGILFFLLGGYLALTACGILPAAWLTEVVQLAYAHWVNQLIMGALGLAVLVLGVLLIGAVSTPQKNTPQYIALKTTDSGCIYASVETVRQIAVIAIEHHNEVLRHRVVVKMGTAADRIALQIFLGLKPDVILPDFSAALQDEVRTAVQSTVGVAVEDIKVVVDSAAAAKV